MYFSSSMTIISATWRTTIPLTFARIGCDPSHKLPEEEKHIVLFTILLLQFLFNLHLFLINVCSYIWLKLNLKRKKKNSKKFHRNFIILLNISMRSLEKTLHSVELLNISMRSSIDIHIYIYIYIYIYVLPNSIVAAEYLSTVCLCCREKLIYVFLVNLKLLIDVYQLLM